MPGTVAEIGSGSSLRIAAAVDALVAVLAERTLPRQHLVKDDSESEDVGAAVGRLAVDLFGRHVGDGADDASTLGVERSGWGFGCQVLFGQHQLGEAEIQDLDSAVVGEEYVLRFEITMDDPLVVRRGKALSDGCRILHRLSRRQVPAGDALTKRFPFEQLHDRVGDPCVRSEVVDGEDVRMIELRHRPGLPLESIEPLASLGHILRQHLDRHVPIEPLVMSAVHLSHSACANPLDDAVVVQGPTDEVLHCH